MLMQLNNDVRCSVFEINDNDLELTDYAYLKQASITACDIEYAPTSEFLRPLALEVADGHFVQQ